MLWTTSSSVVLFALMWYLKTFRISSLPQLYYILANKRGVAVSVFRSFERRAIKLAEKKLDKCFFEKCLDLGLCPDFLKFKPPRLIAYRNTDDLYRQVVQYQLHAVIREAKKAAKEYALCYEPIKQALSIFEGRLLLTSRAACVMYLSKET